MPRFLAFRIEAPEEHVTDIPIRVALPGRLRSARFQKNPLVLFGHTGAGIGTVRDLTLANGELAGFVRFATSERSADLLASVRAGLVQWGELCVDDDGTITELSLVGAFTPNAELLESPTTDAADTSSRVLCDGERLVAPNLVCSCTPSACSCRPLDSELRKEPPMSRQSDSNDSDSPVVAAAARIAARQRTQVLPPLAFSKGPEPGAFPVPSRQFDAGNESELVRELGELVALAKSGELDERSAKRGAELFTALGKLFELTPDPPAVRRETEKTSDASDSPMVAAQRRIAERQRAGLPPLRMSKDDLPGGGNAA